MKYALLYISIFLTFHSWAQTPFSSDELKKWHDLAKEYKETKYSFSFCEIHSEFGAIQDTIHKFGGKIFYLNTNILNDSTILSVGEVKGPFRSTFSGTSHSIDFIFKVLKVDSSYNIRASHILIRDKNENDRIKDNALADKIILKINNGSTTFEKMALKYGTDGTSRFGGDLGWFDERMMIKSFSDACFNAKKGDIFKVETIFGVHVVIITEDKVKLPDTYIVLPIIKKYSIY